MAHGYLAGPGLSPTAQRLRAKAAQGTCACALPLQVHSLRRSGDARLSQFMPELKGVRHLAHPPVSPEDGSIFVAMSGGGCSVAYRL